MEEFELQLKTDCHKQFEIYKLFLDTDLYAYNISRFEVHYWVEELDIEQIKQDLHELNRYYSLLEDRSYGLTRLTEKLNYKKRAKSRLGLSAFKKTQYSSYFSEAQIRYFKRQSGWC
ncbi:hypothetical protein J7384_05590 [Endozoicomonas sp. G2_1]|uniref:hypothetical protein n=1 Tax=Endozoicomonas sp. G2_1 TaxID=2821091 RepID=UPI001ADB9F15|nr:hypothetical protein [Endozoicomonas sp. G2_1]MBO9489828.1 hypothetical protein [Endozoicomonas sp. G2_1]